MTDPKPTSATDRLDAALAEAAAKLRFPPGLPLRRLHVQWNAE